MRDRNLALRVITAVIAVSIVIPALIWSAYGMWLFCVVVSMVALWEFLRLMDIRQGHYLWTLLGLGLLYWLIRLLQQALPHSDLAYAENTVGVLSLPLMMLVALFDPALEQPERRLGHMSLGMLYCYLPLVLFYDFSLRDPQTLQYDFRLPFGVLFLTWTLDVVAYFTGRWMGRRPLYQRISPKKTWEGSIGGALGCLAMAAGMQALFQPSSYHWVVIAAIISVFSQLGDLAESMFKRSAQLKDSGSILPGHGGMLDRFDGLFVSAPFIYLYFLWN
ncbi:MAG: phosphatidate cytidylyltransferase [Bacteroidia bacterium]|nr:phosphatidate cytidylyltransferase [Bacteroidia bacterium]